VYDAAGKVQLDPGPPSARRSEDVVRDVSAHRLSRGDGPNALRAGLAFPVPPTARSRMGELVWNDLGYSRTLEVLHNPRYAGA